MPAVCESRASIRTMASSEIVCNKATLPMTVRNDRARTSPHTKGGVPRNESREKAAIPRMLPRMSSR